MGLLRCAFAEVYKSIPIWIRLSTSCELFRRAVPFESCLDATLQILQCALAVQARPLWQASHRGRTGRAASEVFPVVTVVSVTIDLDIGGGGSLRCEDEVLLVRTPIVTGPLQIAGFLKNRPL